MTRRRRRDGQLRQPVWADAHPVHPLPALDVVSAQDIVSAIVVTHDDGRTIGALLEVLLGSAVDEVVVVASGCTDDTIPTILTAAADDARVRVFVEEQRTGKAAAVNFGLKAATGETVVLVSGDVLPEPGAIELLAAAVHQPGVGIAGGRPQPDNDPADLLGHGVQLLWALHDRLSRRYPKVGEVAVIRREAVRELPPTAVDEAHLQAQIERQGWSAAYVPEAVICNRGPRTVRDFVRQRRRVHAGHLALRSEMGHVVPSLRPYAVLSEFAGLLADQPELRRPRQLLWAAGTATLEAFARLVARADHLRQKEHHVWDIVASAKLDARGAHAGDAGACPCVAAERLAPASADQCHRQCHLSL